MTGSALEKHYKTPIVILSKTLWSETPRIRHQTARMFTRRGHDVYFFEKPEFFFNSRGRRELKAMTENAGEGKLILVRASQLIHHQLRLISFLQYVNSVFEVWSLRFALKKLIGKFDLDLREAIVINFNYDYFFLNKVFGRKVDYTILNDDFVAQARFRQGKHILHTIKKTTRSTNLTLAVSYPILSQVDFDKALFLPWSDTRFKALTKVAQKKKTALFWGHLDHRVDLDLVEYLAKHNQDYVLCFFGPVTHSLEKQVRLLAAKYNNFKVYAPCPLSDIDLSSVCCAVIPYKRGVADIEAVTASNKTFRLFSHGLPLVTYGMPYFIELSAVFKADTYEEFSSYMRMTSSQVYNLQDSLRQAVEENSEEQRYKFLMSNREVNSHVSK